MRLGVAARDAGPPRRSAMTSYRVGVSSRAVTHRPESSQRGRTDAAAVRGARRPETDVVSSTTTRPVIGMPARLAACVSQDLCRVRRCATAAGRRDRGATRCGCRRGRPAGHDRRDQRAAMAATSVGLASCPAAQFAAASSRRAAAALSVFGARRCPGTCAVECRPDTVRRGARCPTRQPPSVAWTASDRPDRNPRPSAIGSKVVHARGSRTVNQPCKLDDTSRFAF